MTTTTVPARHYEHELVLHDGPTDLIDLMAPVLRDGAEVGDHLIVVGEPQFAHDLRDAAPDVPNVRALPEPGRDRFPGRDLHMLHQVLSTIDTTRSGIRVINQMPTMTTREWHGWRRYEAAANYVLAPYRVRGTCAYDSSRLDEPMLDDLRATHTHLRTSAGLHATEGIADLDQHIGTFLDLPAHPIEATPPRLSLSDPSPHAARRAIRELATEIGLPSAAIRCAVLAVSETVTNGTRHGRATVSVKAWTEAARLTVSVGDAGAGPHPLVGLLPAPLHSGSGHGMWILHRLLTDIHHRTDADGYTVRFSVDHATPEHP